MNGQSGILDDFKNAFRRPNYGHIQLILVNVVIWLAVSIIAVILDFSVGEKTNVAFMKYLTLSSDASTFLVRPWTIVTYMFLHTNLFHILFNMLFLYWFGRLIAEFLGSDKVIKLYVLGGLAGGLLFIMIYNLVPFYHDRIGQPMLGASAGVMAVVVGAATFMPHYQFYLIFIGPVKIMYIALFYVVLSFINITGMNAGGEIAHLGGAALGYFYIKQLKAGNDLGGFVISFMDFVKSFFIKQSKIKVSYSKSSGNSKTRNRSASSSQKSPDADQDEIDKILDKISQSGYESLTKDEKQKLFNASKK